MIVSHILSIGGMLYTFIAFADGDEYSWYFNKQRDQYNNISKLKAGVIGRTLWFVLLICFQTRGRAVFKYEHGLELMVHVYARIDAGYFIVMCNQFYCLCAYWNPGKGQWQLIEL